MVITLTHTILNTIGVRYNRLRSSIVLLFTQLVSCAVLCGSIVLQTVIQTNFSFAVGSLLQGSAVCDSKRGRVHIDRF
jgi:hypothetical protein